MTELSDTEAEFEERATNRVVTFDDAVIAIAITILALDLPVPTGDLTNGQILSRLGNDWPDYLAFLISFMVIANRWAAHRQLFRYVARMNDRVVRMNMIWLMLTVLTPFATKLVTGQGEAGVPFTIYALIQILSTGCLLVIAWQIQIHHLLRRDAPDQARHVDLVPYLGIIVAFGLSIPLAFTGAHDWAFALWALTPRIGHLIRRFSPGGRLTVDEDRPDGGQTR